MNSIRTLMTLLFAAVLASACSDSQKTFSDKYDQAEMQQAMEQAQATLGEFLERARHPQPGDEAFNVKVKLTDSGGTEHLWIGDLKLDKEPYTGKITMDAEILRNVKVGQTCTFRLDEVSDWMYMSNGKLQGNRTLRVLMKSMPKEEADTLKAKLGME